VALSNFGDQICLNESHRHFHFVIIWWSVTVIIPNWLINIYNFICIVSLGWHIEIKYAIRLFEFIKIGKTSLYKILTDYAHKNRFLLLIGQVSVFNFEIYVNFRWNLDMNKGYKNDFNVMCLERCTSIRPGLNFIKKTIMSRRRPVHYSVYVMGDTQHHLLLKGTLNVHIHGKWNLCARLKNAIVHSTQSKTGRTIYGKNTVSISWIVGSVRKILLMNAT
jgi:hypothetical protein